MDAVRLVLGVTAARPPCNLSTHDKVSSLVRGADVDQRGQQQQLWWLVQQDQIVAPQPVIVHPAAVYLEGCRVVMLLLVEECGAL